ncbi:PIG-L family deacetylase [Oxalobacteraceae bacterium CAVE-383]|nr:PIG-L family deacetylase [Oxalobacteraceae bacterium CAVE-383]
MFAVNAAFSGGKLLVFSPHMDDAVLSCGELIAQHPETCVVTVFAAAPPGFSRLTDWDAASGFRDARQAIECRRREDGRALSLLAARPAWLDFCDAQYEATPTLPCLTAALLQVLRAHAPDTVLLPAGLFHSDHVLLHRALLSARRAKRSAAGSAPTAWLMYEDALYRRIRGLLQRRLAALARAGVGATPLAFEQRDDARSRKRTALACYASQLHALDAAANGHDDAYAPERYWRLDNDADNDSDSDSNRDEPAS